MSAALQALRAAIGRLPATTGPDLRIEDLVDPAMAALPALLASRDAWNSLYIDYEPPFLMRLHIPVTSEDGARRINISLHHFFGAPGQGPSDTAGLKNPYESTPGLVDQQSANNYHPHPWASAFLLLEGRYRQRLGLAEKVGYNPDQPPPQNSERTQDAKDPLRARYAFNDQLIWHQVLPNNGQPVSSLMITYIPEDWTQTGPRPGQKQRPLTKAEKDFMFEHFKRLLAQPALQTAPKASRHGHRP